MYARTKAELLQVGDSQVDPDHFQYVKGDFAAQMDSIFEDYNVKMTELYASRDGGGPAEPDTGGKRKLSFYLRTHFLDCV